MKTTTLLISLAALGLARAGDLAVPAPAIQPGPEPSSGWQFTTALYAPLMGLEGDIGVAGLAPVEVDVSFDDILENLDGSLSGSFEARKGPWSITADAIWLKISTAANPVANSYLRVSQEQLMASLSVGYEIYGNECTSIDFLVGAELVSLDVDVDLLTPLLPVTSRSGSGSEEWIDPYVGLRFQHHFGGRWTVFASGVYGGFGVSSEEYWQALAGIAYQLTENTALALAYRVISFDYQQGGFVYDTETSGPNLGLVIRF
jgi:hypothetical protein